MINDDLNRSQLVNDISTTFNDLRQLLTGFNHETLNLIPFSGSWTAGQVAEHIIRSTGGLSDNKTEPTDRPADQQVPAIKEMFLDFSVKFKADPFLQPKKDSHNKEEVLSALLKIEEKLKNITLTADLEALCLDLQLPVFGYLTRYEWLRFILYHTQRHTHQIKHIYTVLNGQAEVSKES